MRLENIPTPPSPEQPPLAPYDPPAPAPQAAAWRRALKVVLQQANRARNAELEFSGRRTLQLR